MKISTISRIYLAALISTTATFSNSGSAAVIYSGSHTTIGTGTAFSSGNQADYSGDLDVLGTTDWAYYQRVDSSSVSIANSLAGGSGLESIPIGFNGTGVNSLGNHRSNFSYTDGVSPIDGANAGLGAVDAPWLRHGPTVQNSPVYWELSLNSTVDFQVLHLFVGTGESALKIEAVQNGSVLGTVLTTPFTGGSATYDAKITFGGEASSNFLFRITSTNRSQDSAALSFGGAALSPIPEPSSATFLGLVILGLALRRRR